MARDLERKFFDIDTEFEREVGMKIKEFVAQNSWPEFRKREEETLRKTIQENPSGAVIATGGGVIETPVRVAVNLHVISSTNSYSYADCVRLFDQVQGPYYSTEPIY